MWKLIVILIAAFAHTANAQSVRGIIRDRDDPIEMCKTGQLKPAVEALLKPILIARATADRARRMNDSAFDAAFDRLLKDTTGTGLEGRVALMAYYVGDMPAEALLTQVHRDGNRAYPLVLQYQTCRPSVSFELQIPSIPVIRRLYWQYRQ
jgi:hypothetical protein